MAESVVKTSLPIPENAKEIAESMVETDEVRQALRESVESITEQDLHAGQIYSGGCLVSHEPNLIFRYILLSRAPVDCVDHWLLAQFSMGFVAKHDLRALGAQTITLYPYEIIDAIVDGKIALVGDIGGV